jgi:superfamily II DNA/RNA helicase
VSDHDKTFADLGVQPEICQALEKVGITHPFPIQSMTLPVAISGHDIIGQAKTGTGKTLGFAVPILTRVSGPGEPGWDDLAVPGAPQALVVVPTRELAVQVAGDVDTAGALRAARVLTVYGGRAYEPQIEALRRGVEIVVGTPGRLLDLAQQGHLTLAHARTVVLDEADEMLDLGFLPDVERMLAMTPAGRQTMLFSATMPGAVVALARRYMTQPTHIRAADPDDSGATVKATAQFVYRAHSLDKVEVLARLLQAEGRGLSIVFTRTKRTAAKVAEDLAGRGFASAAIHGDLGQGAREQALRAFRNGKVDVLVATDVAARGIDVEDVTHVINYQCPEDEKTYLHRIGRTGRAGKIGTAITFVDWDDLPRWGLIDKSLDLGIPEPEETYSTSPHFFEELRIPAGITGVLPTAARLRAGLAAEEVEDLGETGRGRRGEAGSAPAGRGGGRTRGGRSDGGRAEGGRGDGPRSDRRRDHGSSDEAAGPRDADSGEAARPARTRQRRRTRAGQPIGEQSGSESGAVTADQGSTGPAKSPAGDGAEGGDRAKRRRRRGGRGRGRGAGGEAGDAGENQPAVASVDA